MTMTEQPNNASAPRPSMKRSMIGGAIFGIALAFVFFVLVDGMGGRDDSDKPSTEGVYDVSALRATDPALIGWREVRRVPTGLDSIRGIAITAGDTLYLVGDRGLHRLEGSRLVKLADLPDRPRCIAVADAEIDDDHLYIGFDRYVAIYDSAGSEVRRFDTRPDDAVLTSIAVLPRHVAVADAGRRVVVLYSKADGKIVQRIGRADDTRGIPGLIIPSPHLDVAWGPDNLLRVVNPGRRRVEVYTIRGDLETHWGFAGNTIEGFFGCCNPTDIAMLNDGSTVTAEKGVVPRIKLYGPGGSFRSVVAPSAAFDYERFAETGAAIDLVVDSKGRVIALDPVSKDVIVYERIAP